MKNEITNSFLVRDVIALIALLIIAAFIAMPFLGGFVADRAVAEAHQQLSGETYNSAAAITAFERALRFDPKNKDALFSLARLYGLSGKYDEALSLIAQYKALYPEENRIYYIAGLTYGFKEEYAAAAKEFSTFIDSGDSGWGGYLDLAWVLFEQGKYDEAKVVLNNALNTFEPNVWLLTSRGAVGVALQEDTATVYLEAAQDLAAHITPEIWRASYSFNNPADVEKGIAQLQAIIALNLRLAHGDTGTEGIAQVLQSPFVGTGPQGFRSGVVVAACVDATCTTTSCVSATNACGQVSVGTYNSCTGTCDAVVPSMPVDYGQACSIVNDCGATVSGTINCNGQCSASRSCTPNQNPNDPNDTQNGTNGGSGGSGSGGFTGGGNGNGGAGYGPGSVTISATPTLIKPGGSSTITWVGTDVESCSVTGTDGSSWTGALGTRTVELSEETEFTVQCEDFYGDTVGDSVKVRILPDWQET